MRVKLALCILSLVSLSDSSAQVFSNKYVKITAVTTCYTPYSGAWYPTLYIKFITKMELNYIQVSGTFINTKESSSLGQDMSNEIDLIPGISYTLKLDADSGWRITNNNMPVKITPKMTVDLPGLNPDISFNLPAVTKFVNRECP